MITFFKQNHSSPYAYGQNVYSIPTAGQTTPQYYPQQQAVGTKAIDNCIYSAVRTSLFVRVPHKPLVRRIYRQLTGTPLLPASRSYIYFDTASCLRFTIILLILHAEKSRTNDKSRSDQS